MSDIVSNARALVGVKFRHQGRSAITGVDCVGLLVLAADGRLKDVADYPPFGSKRLLREVISQMTPVTSPSAGDIVLFTRSLFGAAIHVGIAVDAAYERVIHADAATRMVVEVPLQSVGTLHSSWRVE